MAKHTPGPWKSVYSGSGDFDIIAPGDVDVASVIGDWSHMHHDPEVSCRADITEANARLIAAAPVLLEALMELAEDFENCIAGEGFDRENCDCPVLEKACAAIARATGTKL